MGERYMRVIVFFDLPVETSEERRAYRAFQKGLVRKGFFMMQESVYTKIVLNANAAKAVLAHIRAIKPRTGLIQALTVTEKQYAGMELILGEAQTEVIDSSERLVIL